ncbi:MAG: tRNA uridine-5-carboxymethylaminomethyl(34) synthesis GTPase MnmE [Rhodobacteraceae bacterium CG17_big_fil_post_rev_8_21_14_2_50_63_15]|nr:tRNA uridine-5-carboxymethylaminomethyl(34) synthesis GTPase MnmE [Roseovarius sp.]PIV78373.1 MAG: tRNA uridine-5-carboxymethylaminomethyl(34) synthesis GTPase MnmE [Rhodobacteraceae bacterium CG17_big_fil_post_rev_8_21_14_2_50_63_15]
MGTIYAVSTAQGKAGIAVIRVSGPAAFKAGVALSGPLPEPRRAALRVLRDENGKRLDEALVLVFPENESFTGEESVEFQVHGSIAVVSAVLATLARMDGLRMAAPGEFTRRALENGRLDLTQVEALADLIEAETEAQRVQAMRVLSGNLGRKCEAWRKNLVRAAALMEATIDFVDEEVPENVLPEVNDLVLAVSDSLRNEIAGVGIAERIRGGFEVAIVGAPNVGKSTLLNRLAGREAAITSEYAGTTRDVLEVRMDLGGLPVTVLDTAGLRAPGDPVEAIGIERARGRATAADLRVFLVEADGLPDFDPEPDDIVVQAKADLRPGGESAVSGLTGEGVSELIERVSTILRQRTSAIGLATRARHAEAMSRGLLALDAACALIQEGECSADLVAEELRSAIRALDSLVGRIDIEMVLDEIFASFCVGK